MLENVFFDVLHIAGYSLPRIPGALSSVKVGVQASAELDGVMGSNLLYRFNQTCDFSRRMLYLEPNNYLYTPFYDFLQPEPAFYHTFWIRLQPESRKKLLSLYP